MAFGIVRAAVKTTVQKATFVTPSAALLNKNDVLTRIALDEIRTYKPAKVEVSDPALTKKFTPPAAPAAKVPEVTKEELEAYAKE
ncbi:hypothetical protein GGF32_004748 [Allomyces javanicus]|nr:hypothetical protein GGF32_004748 [Allomyces javanicus]